MNDPIFLFSVIKFVISTFLAFACMSLMLRLSMWVFKIKNSRLRACLRLVPLVCVFLDAFLNGAKGGHWLNPLDCSSCLQKWLLSLLPQAVQSQLQEEQLSLISWMAQQFPLLGLKVVVLAILGVTIWKVVQACTELYFGEKFLKQLLAVAVPAQRQLQKVVLPKNVRLLFSEDCSIPFAAKNRYIVVSPSLLEGLGNEQFECIIAHELEHLCWKDPLLRTFCHFAEACLWWIPLKSWLRQMEEEQEEACDQAIVHYHLEASDLATAILKTSQGKNMSYSYCCSLAAHHSLRRVQALFHGSNVDSPSLLACLTGIGLGVLLIISCLI